MKSWFVFLTCSNLLVLTFFSPEAIDAAAEATSLSCSSCNHPQVVVSTEDGGVCMGATISCLSATFIRHTLPSSEGWF